MDDINTSESNGDFLGSPQKIEAFLDRIVKSNQVRIAVYWAYEHHKRSLIDFFTGKTKADKMLASFAKGKDLDCLLKIISEASNKGEDLLVYSTTGFEKPINEFPPSKNISIKLEIRRFGPLYYLVKNHRPEFDKGFFPSLKYSMDWLYGHWKGYIVPMDDIEKLDFSSSVNRTISSSLNGKGLINIERSMVNRFRNICFKCKNNFEFGTAPSVRVDSEMFEFYKRWGNLYLCELEDRLGITA
jgi:hypothetical protein